MLLNKLNRIWLTVFKSSTDLDLKDTNDVLRDQDVSPPSLALYNSGDIFMQKEHVDLTQVLDASQISLICSIFPSSCTLQVPTFKSKYAFYL